MDVPKRCDFPSLSFRDVQASWSGLKVKVKSLSHVWLWNPMDCMQPPRLLHPWDFSGKNLKWVAISFSRAIFVTQGLNPGLLHCRQTLYPLSHLRRYQKDRLIQWEHWGMKSVPGAGPLASTCCFLLALREWLSLSAYCCGRFWRLPELPHIFEYLPAVEHVCVCVCVCVWDKVHIIGLLWSSSGQDSALPLQGSRFNCLSGNMPHAMAKKKKW